MAFTALRNAIAGTPQTPSTKKRIDYNPNIDGNGSRFTEQKEDAAVIKEPQGPVSSLLLGPQEPSGPSQQEQYAASLASTQAEFDRIQAETKQSRDESYNTAAERAEASRRAWEDQKNNQRTLTDNTSRDLNNSGEAIIVDGGSANAADAAEGDDLTKKKREGGAISTQLGINV